MHWQKHKQGANIIVALPREGKFDAHALCCCAIVFWIRPSRCISPRFLGSLPPSIDEMLFAGFAALPPCRDGGNARLRSEAPGFTWKPVLEGYLNVSVNCGAKACFWRSHGSIIFARPTRLSQPI